MCDPVSIISGAATLGGTLMQQRAASQQREARDNAMNSFYERQDRLSDEAQALFDQSLAQSRAEPARADVAANAAERVAAYDEYTGENAYDSAAAGQNQAPEVIKTEIAKALNGRTKEARDRITALAKMQGFGDRMQDRGVGLTRTDEHLRMLSGFGQGNRGVAEAELTASKRAGQKSSMIGDLLVGGGQIGLGMRGDTGYANPPAVERNARLNPTRAYTAPSGKIMFSGPR